MNIKAFVIHVRGNEEREKHITKELKKFNINFEFILDGNIEDLSDEKLTKYFTKSYQLKTAGVSCSLKHILACEQIVKQNLDKAIIFEDDIFLKSNTNAVVDDIIKEIEEEKLSNYIISLENSTHGYVLKKDRIKGKLLYKRELGRCAGAYIADIEFAKTFLKSIEEDKCHCEIDWYHNHLSEQNKISIYWAHPFIATQGSHNGKMKTLLDNRKKAGFVRRLTYFFQTIVKQRIEPEKANK